MKELRLPSNWNALSSFNKLCYLITTHQAQDFSEAGKLLSERRKGQRASRQESLGQMSIRLPYKDQD